MRASIRGSIRRVMVTDSEISELAATVASISRSSIRLSAQKAASASSLSKSGTSSQLTTGFILLKGVILIIQGLVELALVEKPLFRLEQPREYDSNRFSVG